MLLDLATYFSFLLFFPAGIPFHQNKLEEKKHNKKKKKQRNMGVNAQVQAVN